MHLTGGAATGLERQCRNAGGGSVETAFRYADRSDAASIHRLVELAYRGETARKSWTSEAALLSQPRTSTAEVEGLIADPDHRFVVAEAEGRIVGCALIERRGDEGYFGMLTIDPALQTAGLGTRLLARVEGDVRELWQATAMTLRVISLRSEMIAWYERRGYALTGRHDPFPFDQHPASGRSDFDFVEMRKAF